MSTSGKTSLCSTTICKSLRRHHWSQTPLRHQIHRRQINIKLISFKLSIQFSDYSGARCLSWRFIKIFSLYLSVYRIVCVFCAPAPADQSWPRDSWPRGWPGPGAPALRSHQCLSWHQHHHTPESPPASSVYNLMGQNGASTHHCSRWVSVGEICSSSSWRP